MTQFPDGSVTRGLFGPAFRVGWLGPDLPGRTGDARACLPTLLALFDAGCVSPSMGYHSCHFCDGTDSSRPTPTTSPERLPGGPQSTYAKRSLGSAELVVRGTQGQVFAVPNLIIHYIDAHDYLPPQDFVDACLAGPGPFGLTVAQIAEGAVNQPELTWGAVCDGALETCDLGDGVALSLYELMLETHPAVPDALIPELRPLRARWRDRPWGVREILRWWFDDMGPDERQATLDAWLDGTRSWSGTSRVYPVAATLPYDHPNTWFALPVNGLTHTSTMAPVAPTGRPDPDAVPDDSMTASEGAQPVRLIGYWRSEPSSCVPYPKDSEQAQAYERSRQVKLGWPDPADFVDADWDSDTRSAVLHHLETGTLVNQTRGHSQCRLCGRENASAEITDGAYAWPEGLPHYVREHAVRLPQAFVDHVTARPPSDRPLPRPEFDSGGNRDRDWPGVRLQHRLWPYRLGGGALEQSGDGTLANIGIPLSLGLVWRVEGRVVLVCEHGDHHQLYIDVDPSWWRAQATPDGLL